MAPKKKAQIKAQNAANIRWGNISLEKEEEDISEMQSETKNIEPDMAVISTLIQGTNYRRARLGAAVCGSHFPPRTTFYNHQKKLIPKIENATLGFIEKKANNLFAKRKINASGDGRYDSARDAIKCSFAMMDCDENIVLDVETVDKRDEKISSNMLESKAARKVFDRIHEKFGSDSLETLTTDCDNKTYNQAIDAKLNVTRQFDPRHGIRSLNRNFPKVASSLEYNDEFPNVLDGQESKIVSWGVYLIKNIEDSEIRELMWLNSPQHMIGNHLNCSHGALKESHSDWERGKSDPEAFQKMCQFFEKTAKFIKNCKFNNTTQCCESLNNLIGMIAPKRVFFSNSYNVRTLIACGLYNEPHFFSNLLIELDLAKYIPQESMNDIIQYESEREAEILRKRSDEYRTAKNDYRRKRHQKKKSKVKGDYNEDKNIISFE